MVAAFSVYYRSARNEYGGGTTNAMVPAVSELLLTDINGQVLSYIGRGVMEDEETITLDNERWHYTEERRTEDDIRLELIRFRGNNCFIVGWNLGLLFTALEIVVPEWTILDLAADPYLRDYCHDAVLQRRLPGELFNCNMWYTIDRRLFAILATPPDDRRGPIELWSTQGLDEVFRREVTREALFTSSVVRHFFRPFQRRYRERFFDNAYKQMVCGWGTTLKALAATDGEVREAIQNAGKGAPAGQGRVPTTIDELVARLEAERGSVRAWRDDRSLPEFLQRLHDWKLVDHGLSDAPQKVPVYRRAETIPRSAHIREAARVRYPSRTTFSHFVRFELGWMQSVSKSCVGELVKRLDEEFQGSWDAAELWLVGSYAGFADGTHDVELTVNANGEALREEGPPASIDVEGIEIVEPEDPIEPPPARSSAKRTATKKATAAPKSTTEAATSSKTASTTTKKTAAAPKRTTEAATSSKTASSSTSTAVKKRSTSKPPAVRREKAGGAGKAQQTASSPEGLFAQYAGTAFKWKGEGDGEPEVLDLTTEEGERVLVIVETVSAPTSQTTTPTATTERSQTTAGPEPMEVGQTPPLPPIESLILASEQIERSGPSTTGEQRETPTAGVVDETAATAGTALHEHDYARAEGETREESGSDEAEPQPTTESRPPVSTPAEDAAARERESSGEYADALSQPVAPHAETPSERPP